MAYFHWNPLVIMRILNLQSANIILIKQRNDPRIEMFNAIQRRIIRSRSPRSLARRIIIDAQETAMAGHDVVQFVAEIVRFRDRVYQDFCERRYKIDVFSRCGFKCPCWAACVELKSSKKVLDNFLQFRQAIHPLSASLFP